MHNQFNGTSALLIVYIFIFTCIVILMILIYYERKRHGKLEALFYYLYTTMKIYYRYLLMGGIEIKPILSIC